MTRIHIPGVLAMAAIVVASNILVQHLLGKWLTWGALTYPLAFLVTDVMNRVYGAATARRVILAGFVTGVICSIIGSQWMINFGTDADPFMAPAVTLRIAIGSGTAFLIAQMLDVSVFNVLRGGAWWRAPLVSTVIGSCLDTALFFTIAFSAALNGLEPAAVPDWAQGAEPVLGFGPQAPLWVSLALADWAVKLSLAALALVPFRLIVASLTRRAEIN